MCQIYLVLKNVNCRIFSDFTNNSLPTLLENEDEDSLEENEVGEGMSEVKKEGEQRPKGGSASDMENVSTPEAPSLNNITPIAHADEVENAGDVSEKKLSVKYSLGDIVETDEAYHKVWRPKKPPTPRDTISSMKKFREQQSKYHSAPPLLERTLSKTSLLLRQQQLLDRVQATQAVLKDSTVGSPGVKRPVISFKEASRRLISERKEQVKGHSNLSDIVTQYMAKMRTDTQAAEPQTPYSKKGRLGTALSLPGAIPVEEWHKLARHLYD